jgi:hypothetical protein
MSNSAPIPLEFSNITEQEKEEFRQLLEEFGFHVDLERVNHAFMNNESSLTDEHYRTLLTINFFSFLGNARNNPDLITTAEKQWAFQTMGYLGIDPRKVLKDKNLAHLKR